MSGSTQSIGEEGPGAVQLALPIRPVVAAVTVEVEGGYDALLVLLILGTVLPYVTMEHYNARIEIVWSTARLFGAGGLLNGGGI
jgi:hypothetical protein